MLVHRLAGHEQVHDLARALEDAVDAEVAHHALDPDRLLAARRQRALGLVAAAAADLHRVVDELASRVVVFHSLAVAASSRMSYPPRSASALASSDIDSMA